jgi:hypothetical protein
MVSPEAKEFVKKLTSRQICNDSTFKSFLIDPWIVQRSKPTASKTSLSIDIHDNLKKFNMLNQFEFLILQVKNDRISNQIVYEFSLFLESQLAEKDDVSFFIKIVF